MSADGHGFAIKTPLLVSSMKFNFLTRARSKINLEFYVFTGVIKRSVMLKFR